MPAPCLPPTGRLLRQRSAAVTLLFATAIFPLLMLVGLVIDFGWIMQAKSQLDLAADAAAIAAARTAAAGYAAGQTSATYTAEATAAANQWWSVQAGTINAATSATATPSIQQSGQTITATVTYSANIALAIPNVFDWNSTSRFGATAGIANSSTASIMVNPYRTVDFLLDNTSSMMLPSTNTDLALLQSGEAYNLYSSTAFQNSVISGANGLVGWNPSNNNAYTISTAVPGFLLSATGDYCAFACHWTTSGLDYYAVARAVGETLRFDVVQSATVTAIEEMQTLEQVSGQFSVGIFAFGGPAMTSASYLQTIFAEGLIDPTVNGVIKKGQGATNAMNALKNISPPVTGDTPNTNIGTALSDTLAITGEGGNGNTAATPQKSLILITDGVEDDTNPQSIPSTEGPISPSVCNGFKTAGYSVFILYTPYNSSAVYLPYNMALQPYITGAASPSILSALQSCATSSSDVIQATSAADIQAGLVTLLQEAIGSTTRLTN
jgi:Flp pilus assembly protein TadG